MNTQARVIITEDCSRNCPEYCNRYPKIKQNVKPITLPLLRRYPTIILSGGEPMLNIPRTLSIIRNLRMQNLSVLLYIYTAHIPIDIWTVLEEVNGITVTLHKNSTKKEIEDFHSFQEYLSRAKCVNPLLIKRLVIITGIQERIIVDPKVWHFIKIKPMMSEKELIDMSPTKNGVPKNEDLFILKDKDYE